MNAAAATTAKGGCDSRNVVIPSYNKWLFTFRYVLYRSTKYRVINECQCLLFAYTYQQMLRLFANLFNSVIPNMNASIFERFVITFKLLNAFNLRELRF
jgi:hypothetical protein